MTPGQQDKHSDTYWSFNLELSLLSLSLINAGSVLTLLSNFQLRGASICSLRF